MDEELTFPLGCYALVMLNETVLKDALVSMAEQYRFLYLVQSDLIDEIASLREAVRGLDPTFDEVLAQKRKENASDDIRRAALPLLDALVQRVKDGLVI